MKRVTIMRGIPGCGKSWLAKQISDRSGAAVVSTDDEFIDHKTGEYVFDPSLLGRNHARCFARFLDCLKDGVDVSLSLLCAVTQWDSIFGFGFSISIKQRHASRALDQPIVHTPC